MGMDININTRATFGKPGMLVDINPERIQNHSV